MIILKYQYPISEEKLIYAARRSGYTGDVSDMTAVVAHVTELFKRHVSPWIVTLLDPYNVDGERTKAVADSITGSHESI